MNTYLAYIAAKIIRVAAARIEAMTLAALRGGPPADTTQVRALFTTLETQVKTLRSALNGEPQ